MSLFITTPLFSIHVARQPRGKASVGALSGTSQFIMAWADRLSPASAGWKSVCRRNG